MKDVAALAGVSLKTVSRVVNGEGSVATDLAARVRKAADQLDFKPNRAASALRRLGGQTRTIGLLLEDVANPFSSALLRAIEDVARSRGVLVLAGSVDEHPEIERALVQTFVERRVDGLVIVPTGGDQSYLLNERRSGMNIVFVDRRPRLLDADSVVSTNLAGARDGCTHLLRRGHRRIAYVGDLQTIATAEIRFNGYVDAHRSIGITVSDGDVHAGLHTIDDAHQATLRLLDDDDPPTAIFASQNLVTIGAIRALHQRGLQHRIALVGFDDFPMADLLEPAVTVVAQRPRQIGVAAAEMLFSRIDGLASPSQHQEIPTTLIQRGSGELPPPP